MAAGKVASGARRRQGRLASLRGQLDSFMHAAVDTMPPYTRRVAGYHLGWLDRDGVATATNAGKGIRPTLALLSAEAVGGTVQAALPAAAAVELVHNFSLVHDDVIDGDLTRRHRPTVWTEFGTGAAILLGDALLSLAFHLLATSGHPAASDAAKTLSAAVIGMVEGQFADISFETRADIDLSECFAMAEQKTAVLLSCACAVGASFGGGSPLQVAHLRNFGLHLGLAFQLVDDVLGIWGEPALTGKPVHSDLRSRKKSFPVVAALTSGTEAGIELATFYCGHEPLSDDEVLRVAELIAQAGGRTWSEAERDVFLSKALDDLRLAQLAQPAGAELRSLAHAITERDH